MTLTAAEQYYLELLNRARLDPVAEAERHGIDLNQGLAPGTLAGGSRPVLAANALLNSAASEHSSWMLAADVFSHTGANGSSPGQRMAAEGYAFTGSWTWGENIAWSGTTGTINLADAIAGHHAGLFRSAGHRTNTLNGGFLEVGIGQEAGQFHSGSTNWNASMLTTVFARSGSAVFVTGVAYADRDGDGFYSIGEGRRGVTFQIMGGASGASAEAGGYALATTASAQTAVRISHGTLLSDVIIDTRSGNAKLDLVGDTMVLSSVNIDLVSGAVTDIRLLGLNNLVATGNALDNAIVGNAGNNTLYGRDGADSLYGGDGNDLLYGGTGADRLDGGAGARDRAMYSDSATGLRVDLLSPGANTGIAAGDTYLGVEDVFGSGGGDSLLGNAGGNILWGANGNDALYGRDGADSLYGGEGNDLLYGGVGADLLDGGAGARDRAMYSDSATGLRADLQLAATNTGIAAGDTYLGVEDLYGSNAADSLLGNTGGNILWGANGNDVIYGRDGADTLYGGAGNDLLYGGNGLDRLEGGAGADSFVFNTALAGSVDTIADFSVVDDRILLENAIFTALTVAGPLAATAFAVGASATTAAHRIIYNSANGQLLYDADGNGAGAAVHFATLSTGLAVTAADFVVV